MIDLRLLEQLKRHEGFSQYPYLCTGGKISIGYGRNIENVGINKMEAEELLFNDLERIQRDCHNAFDWFYHLNICRQQVVINMVYNLGLRGFKKFKKTIAALDKGCYKEASKEMLDSLWADQVGERAKELSYQMRTGRYADIKTDI